MVTKERENLGNKPDVCSQQKRWVGWRLSRRRLLPLQHLHRGISDGSHLLSPWDQWRLSSLVPPEKHPHCPLLGYAASSVGCTHAYNCSVVPHCCKARPILLDGHRVSVVTAQFCVTATGDAGNEGQGWVPVKLYLYDRLYLTRLWSAVAKGMTYKPLHLLISFSCIFISLTHCEASLPHSPANSSS